jgi:hypothetical protein
MKCTHIFFSKKARKFELENYENPNVVYALPYNSLQERFGRAETLKRCGHTSIPRTTFPV